MQLNNIGPYKKVTFEKYDENTAVIRIQSLSNPEIVSIRALLHVGLSYLNQKTLHSWECEEGFVDATEYIFNKKTQTLPLGLIPRATDYLKDRHPDIKIKVSSEIREIYTNPLGDATDDDIEKFLTSLKMFNIFENKEVIPFAHQIRIIKRGLNGRRISLMACTSAGKSLCIMGIARWLWKKERRKVLVITPSSQLVEQLFTDFSEDYGWLDAKDHVTLIHGESKDKLTDSKKRKLMEVGLGEEAVLKDITISTWQSLQNKPDDFFKVFTAILVDEAHGTRGPVLRSILDKCVNATDYKIGLSGTLPDDGLDAAWIEGALGRKEVVVRLKELIALGILTPVTVHAIRIPIAQDKRAMLARKTYQDEYALIMNNGSRKKVMELLINNDKVNLDQNTLILFKSIASIEDMKEHLEKLYPQFTYHIVIGKVKAVERNEIRRKLESGTGNIILATYGTFKQGVNVKLLHNLVFAEFSKSMYEVVQSLGRIVRRHKLKKHCTVFDIFDDGSYFTKPRGTGYPSLKQNYSVRHYLIRNKYYKDDDIPIIEFGLEGVYESDLNPELLLEKRKKAGKAVKNKKPIEIVDAFDFE